MIALCSEQTRGSLSLRAGSTDPGQRVCGVRTGSSWHRGRPSAARSRVAQRPPPQSCHPRAAAGIKEIVRREIQWGETAVPGPGAPTPRPKDRSGAPAGTECIFAECTERGNVVSLQDLGLEPDQAGLDPAPTPRSRGTRTRSLQFLCSKRGRRSSPHAIVERVEESRRPPSGSRSGRKRCAAIRFSLAVIYGAPAPRRARGRHGECPFVFSSIL